MTIDLDKLEQRYAALPSNEWYRWVLGIARSTHRSQVAAAELHEMTVAVGSLIGEVRELRKSIGRIAAERVSERCQKLATIGELRVRIAKLEGKTLGVWSSDIDTVVAYDLEDVRCVIEEYSGSFEQSLDDFRRADNDKLIAINIDEEVDRAKFAPTFVCERTGFTKARKTAAEWVSLNGRGLLCSTEY